MRSDGFDVLVVLVAVAVAEPELELDVELLTVEGDSGEEDLVRSWTISLMIGLVNRQGPHHGAE